MTTTSADTILRTVTEIALSETGLSATELTPDADLRGMAGVDSVRVLRMIARIERAFDIELEDSDVFGMSTLAEVTAVVERSVREATS
ncbi:acyl carrier protein [Nocardia rhizosphaerae]|uniref:Acyl carrier protein n=1 Tax=Nocardia rhizosphaerae TaxID=1691571 RepID=A0ABV8LEV7_9NOCA